MTVKAARQEIPLQIIPAATATADVSEAAEGVGAVVGERKQDDNVEGGSGSGMTTDRW